MLLVSVLLNVFRLFGNQVFNRGIPNVSDVVSGKIRYSISPLICGNHSQRVLIRSCMQGD